MDIWELLGKAVAGLGGLAVLIIVTARWLGNRWADRLYLKWKHENDRELEALRAQFSSAKDLLVTTVTVASAGYLAAQERRLKAIEDLWEAVLGLNELTGPFMLVYQLLAPGEYQKAFDEDGRPRFATSMTDREFHERFMLLGAPVELARPFLGEELWLLFFVYRALMGRMAWKAIQERDARQIREWDKMPDGSPDSLYDLLEHVLPEEEVTRLRKLTIGGPQSARSLLEQKILEEARRLLTGKFAAELSASEAKRLQEALDEAKRITPSLTTGDAQSDTERR